MPTTLVATLAVAGMLAISSASPAGATAGPVALELLGRFASGDPDGGSEITAYDAATKRMFVTNGVDETVDVVDLTNPSAPTLITKVDLGRPLQSVAVKDGLVAVVIEGASRQAPGELVVLDTDGVEQWRATVGSLPDMVMFTPDRNEDPRRQRGRAARLLRAGARRDDPEGSISVVDVGSHVVATAGFGAYTDADTLRTQGIRIFGPNATPAQDMEPEYIAVAPDGVKAYVTIQEANAVAVVDIASATVESLLPLGYQPHGTVPIDTSDRELPGNLPSINIVDAQCQRERHVHARRDRCVRERRYHVLRDRQRRRRGEYECFPGGRDDLRVSAQGLDPTVFTAAELSNASSAGSAPRGVPLTAADRDASGRLRKVYTYGTRLFTIRATDGSIVWDSGADLEQKTAALLPAAFNGEWNEDTGAFSGFDLRSPNKGPEPEAVETGEAYGRRFAFVGLERTGGVMVYDITDPTSPSFVQYLNTSNFGGNYKTGTAGDVAPEGILFVPGADSPTGKPVVIVSYELSGTTAIFELNGPPMVGAAPDVTVGEAAGTVALDVTLSEDSTEPVTVGYSLVAGSATAGAGLHRWLGNARFRTR